MSRGHAVVVPIARDIMEGTMPVVQLTARVDLVARKLRLTGDDIAAVTDGNEHVRGVITRSDIALRICANRFSAELTQAHEIMTDDLVRCHPSDSLGAIMQAMMEHLVPHVLVTSGLRHRLHGVIHLGHVAAVADYRPLQELVLALSVPVPEVRGAEPAAQ